ncbi:hypothetical protein H2509_13180 [Stappia sp. F7233]|uniref:DUF1653 domain-containing protein n=1 Tax=Stappia albiluteola TaxID=2758565 RepID=A0A839AG54_9HYPH|nr:hypothetical protein [Stappia albiluteola]MBA5778076.1 hypothetical protein [Stappia albiluteola]
MTDKNRSAIAARESQLPRKGEIWQHTKSGARYVIAGAAYNAITDQSDVLYEPLYPCELQRFSRQLSAHPKAFLSQNDDGTPRFHRVVQMRALED